MKRFNTVFGYMVAVTALLSPVAAAATVFQSTYAPADTTATAVNQHLPLEYRLPATAPSAANAGSSSGYCAPPYYCIHPILEQVSTDFTATSNFSASHIVIPLRSTSIGFQRGIGFNISHFDTVLNDWVGLGFAQLDSNYIPNATDLEVELPFGNNSTYEFGTFAYAPISFIAGDKYRISTNGAFGGLGYLSWYASSLAADPGQTVQYSRYHLGGPLPSHDLPNQLAWALTDGGSLASAVPEPASWMLLIAGFGAVGYAMRRKRRIAAFA